MFPDPETGKMSTGISRVRYTHEDMVDLLIACPEISQNEIAARYGYTATWVSQIINSDAFQAKLAARREEIVNPGLIATVNERLLAVANQSLQRVLEKVSDPLICGEKFALESAKMATAALGYGARSPGQGSSTNVAVVVQVPNRMESEGKWSETFNLETISRDSGDSPRSAPA